MKNKNLANDYIIRCQKRLKAIDTLFQEKSWADVVRQSQEVVELALRALLKHSGIEVPRTHDVGNLLIDHKERLPHPVQKDAEKLAEISRHLRRDRELAFYGSDDLTPSEFYKEDDGLKAREQARWVTERVASILLSKAH